MKLECIFKLDNLDGNARLNPLLNKVRLTNLSVDRVVNIAVPFLNLYKPTAAGVGICLGVAKTYVIITDLKKCCQAHDMKGACKNVVIGAFVVSTVALSILMPPVGLILSTGVQLVMDVHALAYAIWDGNGVEALKALLRIAHSGIYIAAAVYALPELIALSILMQGALELYRSKENFAKGEFVEGFANIALSIIRGFKAAPHVKTAHRNHFGNRLTQDDWDRIMLKINTKSKEGTKIDFQAYLKKGYFSSDIKGIDCDEENFDRILFKDIRFADCFFDDLFVESSAFINTNFKDCSLKGTEFFDTVFSQGQFNKSDLTSAVFYQCYFDRFKWLNSDLSQAAFNESVLSNTTFAACKLFEANFFGASVKNSEIKDGDLTDCLLLDTKKDFKITRCTENVITRPVVTMTWVIDYGSTIRDLSYRSVKDFNNIVLPIVYNGDDIKLEALDKEIALLVQQIAQDKPQNMLSIPAEIFKRAKEGSEIGKLRDKIAGLSTYIDGVFLPGGSDIEPELYGHEPSEETHPEQHYQRSMVELALLNLASEKKIPVMGICRGSQMGNVYHGGTLIQDVPNHSGELQNLRPVNVNSEAFKALKDVIGSEVPSISLHHQASDKIGKGLTVVLEYGGVPKALISEDGMQLYTQFHPEFYHKGLDARFIDNEQSKGFFRHFFSHVQSRYSAKDNRLR